MVYKFLAGMTACRRWGRGARKKPLNKPLAEIGDFITSSDAGRLNLIIRWRDEDFVQQVAAQLPWFHNCVLLDKLKSNEERRHYSSRVALPRRISMG